MEVAPTCCVIGGGFLGIRIAGTLIIFFDNQIDFCLHTSLILSLKVSKSQLLNWKKFLVFADAKLSTLFILSGNTGCEIVYSSVSFMESGVLF